MNSFLKWLCIGSAAIIGYVALNSVYDIKYKNGLNLQAKDKTHEMGYRLSGNTPYFNTLNRKTNFGIEHSLDNNITEVSIQRGKYEGGASYNSKKHSGTIMGKHLRKGLEAKIDNILNNKKLNVSQVSAYTPRKFIIYSS